MIDVKKYYEIVNPKSAFEIIEKKVLEPFLNGYSYKLKSGISFVCPNNDNYENKDQYRIDAFNEKAPETFQGVCSYWRSPNGCNMDEVCVKCDNKEASLHFKQYRDYLRIYRCNPLSLWELTYPILINDRVIAVMFAGQIVVKGEINWKTELKEFTKYIDSNCLLQPDNQVKSIEKQINKKDIEQEKKENLIKILNNSDTVIENYNMIQYDIDGFRKRIRDFISFGDLTQKLISLMHDPKRESGERELINEFSEEFDNLQFIEQQKYWNDFEEKIRTLKELPFIDDIKVFTRDRSKYIQQNIVPKGIILFAGDVISNFQLNQLINIDFSKIENSLIRIKSDTYNVYGFRSDKGKNNELCSTLIIITGNIPNNYDVFIKKICDISCNSSNLALMIYRERNTKDDYQIQVKNIGHSFRTPLQALGLIFEKLERNKSNINNIDLHKDINNGIDRIYDANEDLGILLKPIILFNEEVNIINKLSYVIEMMTPLADKRPCKIIKTGIWPEKIIVYSNEYGIQRAIANLVDNAIKYSFSGETKNTFSGFYEVRISVTQKNHFTFVTINNFGIGIQPEKLDSIRNYGVRGDVSDGNRKRGGLGLGLPYAIEIIENSGGIFFIDSKPLLSSKRDEIISYRRYKTSVTFTLPIKKEKQN